MTDVPPADTDPPAIPAPEPPRWAYVPPPPPPAPLAPAPLPPAPLAPAASSSERVRVAWHRRGETDYLFDFWTALGWTILTLGLYAGYVVYQLMRRSRDHNRRRIELLDAAASFAWERARASGLADELRPHFARMASQFDLLHGLSAEFREPVVFGLVALISGLVSVITNIVAFILLDSDHITHDYAEGAIETELSAVYAGLGAPVESPDPARLSQPNRYGLRILATIVTFGVYGFFWEYDVMNTGNDHFRENWIWEDALAVSVQQLLVPA